MFRNLESRLILLSELIKELLNKYRIYSRISRIDKILPTLKKTRTRTRK
jgi:hypothetical protein